MPDAPKSPAPPLTAPFRVEDVPWEAFSHGARFGTRWRPLSAHGGAKNVGVAIEELAPGKQSCPFHFHMLEEEQMFFLEGSATLRLGDERYPVKAGDYVVFPAGQQAGHCLVNEGTETCRFLIIGEKNPNDVMVYPDSGKVRVRNLDANFRRDATVDYWDGEDWGSGASAPARPPTTVIPDRAPRSGVTRAGIQRKSLREAPSSSTSPDVRTHRSPRRIHFSTTGAS